MVKTVVEHVSEIIGEGVNMGQYWYPVNLDKREFINPHQLGSGLKLCEQVGTHPGTATALLILCAAHRVHRGGGEIDLVQGPRPEEYRLVAARTVGRWAGDRIAVVGDYAEDSDLPPEFEASSIYAKCLKGEWKNVSDDVCLVIEHELNGRFTSGLGWRDFQHEEGSE